MLPGLRPRWIVCEDGSEYLDRFTRFLAGEFDFAHALCAQDLLDQLAADRGPAAGVILDLDFRRTPPQKLVDEAGRDGTPVAEQRRRQLAESQGILILRLLRARGLLVPVILYADLDDAGQVAYLEQALAPLAIVQSHEGLLATAARMRQTPDIRGD